jgi:hypothetical protein
MGLNSLKINLMPGFVILGRDFYTDLIFLKPQGTAAANQIHALLKQCKTGYAG